jgi:hypothetical protein
MTNVQLVYRSAFYVEIGSLQHPNVAHNLLLIQKNSAVVAYS